MTNGREISPYTRGDFGNDWPGRMAATLASIRARRPRTSFHIAWEKALKANPPSREWAPRSSWRYGEGLFAFVRRQFEAAWHGEEAPKPCPLCDVPPGSTCEHRSEAA